MWEPNSTIRSISNWSLRNRDVYKRQFRFWSQKPLSDEICEKSITYCLNYSRLGGIVQRYEEMSITNRNKKQESHLRASCSSCRRWESNPQGITTTRTWTAVSYTHLDVYKRQVYLIVRAIDRSKFGYALKTVREEDVYKRQPDGSIHVLIR